MGNSFRSSNSNLINTGSNFEIVLNKIPSSDEEKTKAYLVSYRIHGKFNYDLALKITRDEDGLIRVLHFHFDELGSIFFNNEENSLATHIQTYYTRYSYETIFFNETKNHWGGVTKTNIAYRRLNEYSGSLYLVQQKRKKGDENPCAITVTHYYAFSKQRLISRKKYEVGVSIVVDIRVLNKDFDVSWRGYSEHPSWALFQMFEQVNRAWVWKWTACPHCAAQTHAQRFETETENDDDDEEKNHLQQSRQIGGNINITNQGVVKGNNCGSLFVKQLIIKRYK